jgi:signal-transduction protein with cAMP-binding, CBS, and nucleotidyltransferase domain
MFFMRTGYKVGEIMVRNTFTVSPNFLIIDCAKKMAEREIGSLVVVENGKVVGIVTEQDLARKALARGIDVEKTQVSKIMSSNVNTIEPDRDIYDAFVLMGINRIKHLPVVLQGELKGMITSKDVIQIQPGLIDLLSFKNSSS